LKKTNLFLKMGRCPQGFIVLSLFVQRKNQRKGAGNDNCSLFVRPLRNALMALPNRLQFAPFPVCQRTY
jgi:hypothetical protein